MTNKAQVNIRETKEQLKKAKEEWKQETKLNLRQRLRAMKAKNFNSIENFNDEFLILTHAICNMSQIELIDAYISS